MVVVKTILALIGNIAVWEIALIVIMFMMAFWYERTKTKKVAHVLELAIHYTMVLVFPLVVITIIVLFFCGYGIPIDRPY